MKRNWIFLVFTSLTSNIIQIKISSEQSYYSEPYDYEGQEPSEYGVYNRERTNYDSYDSEPSDNYAYDSEPYDYASPESYDHDAYTYSYDYKTYSEGIK